MKINQAQMFNKIAQKPARQQNVSFGNNDRQVRPLPLLAAGMVGAAGMGALGTYAVQRAYDRGFERAIADVPSMVNLKNGYPDGTAFIQPEFVTIGQVGVTPDDVYDTQVSIGVGSSVITPMEAAAIKALSCNGKNDLVVLTTNKKPVLRNGEVQFSAMCVGKPQSINLPN